ncbi:MAG: hypothetical protein QW222_06915 [Candidatus Bathyarchaeia archaeon]
MMFKSKLKTENIGILLAFAFYAIVGISCFAVLPSANFPPHIGIIGILSLIAAYGLFKKRLWSLWLVIALLFIATTFSVYTLYYMLGKYVLLDLSMIVYLILTWFFTVYIATKRKILKS